jgi:hypothetical protein
MITKKYEMNKKAHLAELERLNGCPMVLVIEGRCNDPECQNSVVKTGETTAFPNDMCLRLRKLVLSGDVSGELEGDLIPKDGTSDSKSDPEPVVPAPIIQTQPRIRCVL